MLLSGSLDLRQVALLFIEEVTVPLVALILRLVTEDEAAPAPWAPLLTVLRDEVPVQAFDFANNQVLALQPAERIELEIKLLRADEAADLTGDSSIGVRSFNMAIKSTDIQLGLDLLLVHE